MAIRLRTSSAALALLLVVCLGLTSRAVYAQCGIDPQITIDIGTADVPPYSRDELNDTAFVAYSVVGGPSVSLEIPVTRYLAPVDPASGKIPEGLVSQLESDGVLFHEAKLQFGYSFHRLSVVTHDKLPTLLDDTLLPVRPKYIRFNGSDVTDKLTVTASKISSTSGPGNTTTRLNGVVVSMHVPIEYINFPKTPGVNGNAPSPGMNSVDLEFEEGTFGDTNPPPCHNYTTYSGGAVSWAGLSIRALAPIVLVHGIGGEANDWKKGTDANGHLTEAEAVTTFLVSKHVTYSNKINLTEHGRRDGNGAELRQFFREAATELGAKGIHIIAHSKGGLDTRSFLAQHADDLYGATGIHLLSLSTLSTPHHGSILADLSILERGEGRAVSDQEHVQTYLTADRRLNLLNKLPFINFGPQLPGLKDLTTSSAGDFNIAAPFPDDIELYTYGADADIDPIANTEPIITAGQTTDQGVTLNETSPMIPRIEPFYGRKKVSDIATAIYRVGRDFSRVKVIERREYRGFLLIRRLKILIKGDQSGTYALQGPSDLAVTIPSSHLDGEIAHLDFTGPSGLNHTSMRTKRVAVEVLNTITQRFPL